MSTWRRWIASAAGTAALLTGAVAHGAWGLKFEVRLRDTDAWSSSVSVGAVEGTVIEFRFGAYFDPEAPPVITTVDGTGTAMALARFTGSNQATGFAVGDMFQNVVRTISGGSDVITQIAGATIGTSSASSFGSQLFPGVVPFEPYKQIYVGEVRLGPGSVPRMIEIRNKTFGVGNTAGLTFFNSASPVNKQPGAPQASGPGRADLNASITVLAPCPGDFNNDRIVNESDFLLFVNSYQYLLCSDPAMPAGCPADLNGDELVDDTDFQFFVLAFNEHICP